MEEINLDTLAETEPATHRKSFRRGMDAIICAASEIAIDQHISAGVNLAINKVNQDLRKADTETASIRRQLSEAEKRIQAIQTPTTITEDRALSAFQLFDSLLRSSANRMGQGGSRFSENSEKQLDPEVAKMAIKSAGYIVWAYLNGGEMPEQNT